MFFLFFLFFFFTLHKISWVFFLKQPKLLSIWPTTFPNSKQFQIRVCEFLLHMITSTFCAYLNYLQNPVLKFKNNLLKTKNRTPFEGKFHLTSQYYNTTGFSNPFLGEFTKYPVRQIFLNILNPSPGETFTKHGMASTSSPNRLSQLHKYAKVYVHSSDKPPMCEIPGQPHQCSRNSITWIKILISNHHLPRPLTSYCKILLTKTLSTIKFIYENIVYYKISFIKILFTVNVNHSKNGQYMFPSHLSFLFTACICSSLTTIQYYT